MFMPAEGRARVPCPLGAAVQTQKITISSSASFGVFMQVIARGDGVGRRQVQNPLPSLHLTSTDVAALSHSLSLSFEMRCQFRLNRRRADVLRHSNRTSLTSRRGYVQVLPDASSRGSDLVK